MKMYHSAVFVLSVLLSTHCGGYKGEFGWATTIDEGISPLEQEFMIQTQFEMTREDLFFTPEDTIHFVYSFSSYVSKDDEFFLSLNRKSIDYLEVDLRRKKIEEGKPIIRDSYRSLEVGDYILKLAYEGEVFDEVGFKVMPEDGYFTDNLERDLMDETEDDIIRYSR